MSDALTNFNARPAPRHGAMVIDMRIVCVHSTVMDAVCPIAMVVNSKEMRGIASGCVRKFCEILSLLVWVRERICAGAKTS